VRVPCLAAHGMGPANLRELQRDVLDLDHGVPESKRKDTKLKAWGSRRWFRIMGARFLAAAILGCTAGSALADDAPGPRSLRALEQRALQAQALARHVEELERRMDAHREQLRELEAALTQLRAERDAVSEERDVLRDDVAELKQMRARQERLLAMYRSGDFEYYQVREGDTAATIAANPMVYDDSKRAVWIEHANALPPNQTLVPGTVLVIPRFSEGITHDL
jgi:septal ring factor EnvC (AmiA/AmiB activator)